MFSLKTVFFILVFMGFMGRAGAAEGSLAQSFRRSAVNILNTAKLSGVMSLGDGKKAVSIDHLLAQISEVKFVELSEFKKPAGATRFSAFFDASTKTVYLNAEEKLHEDYAGALALHEVLGALGYADLDYQVSLGLYMVNLLPPVAAEELELSTARTRLMMRMYGPEKIYQNDVAESLIFPRNPLGIIERSIRAQTLIKVQMDEAFGQKFQVDLGPDGTLLNTNGGSTSGVGGGGGYNSFALKARLFEALQKDSSLEYWQAQKYLAQVLTTDFGFLTKSGLLLRSELSSEEMNLVVELFKASRP